MSNALNEADREIEDLLPFYHNGRIGAADKARVEAALRTNAELRRRLDLIAEEASVAIALNEQLRAPSSRALDALMAKIEAEPKRAAQRIDAARLGIMERFGAFLAMLSPRTLAYATAAAVAIIALQGVVLTGVMPGGGSGSTSYQTASAPAQSDGTFVLISFAPEAKAGAIADLLKSLGASIVEGPRASGLYRVRIGDKALPKDEAERILARLRAARDVVALVAPDR
ncbi:MAG: hypothetical protein ACRDBL_07635 [Rhabdaerophilum sp.]